MGEDASDRIQYIREYLLKLLNREESLLISDWTLRVLKKHADPDLVMEGLVDIYVNGPSELELKARNTILQMDAEKGIEVLIPLLQHPDRSIRWCTCDAFDGYGDSRHTSLLVQMLLSDPDEGVRCVAAFVLGRIGDNTAIPALEQAKASDTATDFHGWTMEELADRAIKRIVTRMNSNPQ